MTDVYRLLRGADEIHRAPTWSALITYVRSFAQDHAIRFYKVDNGHALEAVSRGSVYRIERIPESRSRSD